MDNLSKLGSGVVYKDTYDPSLLETINRDNRRKDYIHPMYGGDVWTAFEFSFLLPSGLPQFHVIRIWNPANSVNIFESKSLKLYLNSFNNTTFNSLEEAIQTVKADLERVSGGEILVGIMKNFDTSFNSDLVDRIDEIQVSDNPFVYEYDKSLLKIHKTVSVERTEFLLSNLLRSNCEITNQPDWASILIQYTGYNIIDRESLLRYIISYRKHQEFHEPTCERIYQDLFDLLDPMELVVTCQYTRRGGIDINPIRSSYSHEDGRGAYYINHLPKLLQQ